jgi:hypothetical protein
MNNPTFDATTSSFQKLAVQNSISGGSSSDSEPGRTQSTGKDLERTDWYGCIINFSEFQKLLCLLHLTWCFLTLKCQCLCIYLEPTEDGTCISLLLPPLYVLNVACFSECPKYKPSLTIPLTVWYSYYIYFRCYASDVYI